MIWAIESVWSWMKHNAGQFEYQLLHRQISLACQRLFKEIELNTFPRQRLIIWHQSFRYDESSFANRPTIVYACKKLWVSLQQLSNWRSTLQSGPDTFTLISLQAVASADVPEEVKKPARSLFGGFGTRKITTRPSSEEKDEEEEESTPAPKTKKRPSPPPRRYGITLSFLPSLPLIVSTGTLFWKLCCVTTEVRICSRFWIFLNSTHGCNQNLACWTAASFYTMYVCYVTETCKLYTRLIMHTRNTAWPLKTCCKLLLFQEFCSCLKEQLQHMVKQIMNEALKSFSHCCWISKLTWIWQFRVWSSWAADCHNPIQMHI